MALPFVNWGGGREEGEGARESVCLTFSPLAFHTADGDGGGGRFI